jgi:hypothetical protein
MTDIKPLNNRKFHHIDGCIYCGSRAELADEHIIPFGLGGSAVLPNSSCQNCAKITGRIEQFVLRGEMWGVRSALGLSTRNKKESPKELPIKLIKNGNTQEVMLPIERHPVILNFPIFVPPGIVTGEIPKGITFRYMVMVGFGKPLKDVLRDEGADDAQFTHKYKIPEFAKMLAKIGWAMAAAEGLLDRIERTETVLDAFMNENSSIGYWVGTYQGQLKKNSGTLHTIRFEEKKDLGLLVAVIKLFSFSQTPEYSVVLGRIK